MTRRVTAGLTASILLTVTSACNKPVETAPPPAQPISEADAGKIVDRTEAAWASMDAARIKALYASNIVGFDVTAPPLATDRVTWDRNQDAFAAAKLDKVDEKTRKIQILSPEVFVLSGLGDMTSTAIPANKVTLRYTDVFQKQGDGSWLVVNEHVSAAPKG